MSGAEAIAGLALSAVSVAALFKTCIECFDIVVAGKNFSEDFEQLCALFSLQRARFGLWGESVGLVPNPTDGRRLRYDQNLNRPDIRPGVERILHNIKTLLEEANKVDDRYGALPESSTTSEISSSKGIDVFKGPFERFKSRIRKHQKDTSTWKVTRWAIHDAGQFEETINRLEKFVDGLEKITKSLGLLQEQHARLREEIESISDTQSLKLLRDASSSRKSSARDVSDTASRRLLLIEGSIPENQTIVSTSTLSGSINSFVTADNESSLQSEGTASLDAPIPGAWPRSLRSGRQVECNTEVEIVAPLMEHRPPLLESLMEDLHVDATPQSTTTHQTIIPDVPQNQRLLSSLFQLNKPRKPLSFAEGDAHYGERLASIKDEDETYWNNKSGSLLAHANAGSSAAKRMFFELRNIKAGKIPFVSAVPLGDRLDKILASIEGPPETPYEGGVFWITIKLPDNDPFGPPLMRFQTKIYHPNISPQGNICADYREKWNSFLSGGSQAGPGQKSSDSWYSSKSTDVKWSLGALLTALCGLLGSPNVDDPLVPEIAQKFLQDYDGFCNDARSYTKRFANGDRPADKDLVFLEEPPDITLTTAAALKFDPPYETGLSEAVQDSCSTMLETSYHAAKQRYAVPLVEAIRETLILNAAAQYLPNLKNLVPLIRIRLQSLPEVTDLEIYHALSHASSLSLFNEKIKLPNFERSYALYTEPFEVYFRAAKVYVFPLWGTWNSFEVGFIDGSSYFSVEWKFLSNRQKFRELDQLLQRVVAQEFGDNEPYLPLDPELFEGAETWHPGVYAHLVEWWLRESLPEFGHLLLRSPEFFVLTRPDRSVVETNLGVDSEPFDETILSPTTSIQLFEKILSVPTLLIAGTATLGHKVDEESPLGHE
ncbi:Ubiquitin-conjugating enzyme E2 [Lachnellula suecica]|uniref:Ubiquitin-conjugating enzyme E2 n=1 Tax=Lachnellula suecica TaxID=602035 RepID=A0A8T9C093_9HELO|nr:Ubiquitin-conjugating enzyme E2 [Lachnellula suecica]